MSDEDEDIPEVRVRVTVSDDAPAETILLELERHRARAERARQLIAEKTAERDAALREIARQEAAERDQATARANGARPRKRGAAPDYRQRSLRGNDGYSGTMTDDGNFGTRPLVTQQRNHPRGG